MNNKHVVDIIMISGIMLLFIILFFKPICIFKYLTHIPCISCGLTRAFKAIMQLKFLDALKYNVLSIPLFIFILIFLIIYIISKILKKDYIYTLYENFSKHWILTLLILIIGWIINLIIYYTM